MLQRWTGKTMADKVAAIMAELNLVATKDPGADVDLALRRLCLDSTGTFSKKVARLLSELFDSDVDMEAAERARVAAEVRLAGDSEQGGTEEVQVRDCVVRRKLRPTSTTTSRPSRPVCDGRR